MKNRKKASDDCINSKNSQQGVGGGGGQSKERQGLSSKAYAKYDSPVLAGDKSQAPLPPSAKLNTRSHILGTGGNSLPSQRHWTHIRLLNSAWHGDGRSLLLLLLRRRRLLLLLVREGRRVVLRSRPGRSMPAAAGAPVRTITRPAPGGNAIARAA